jgi:V8-like Glu-specific endopeptidase
MKVQLLLNGIALSAVAVGAVAAETMTTAGQRPVLHASGTMATVMQSRDLRQDLPTSARFQRARPLPLPQADRAQAMMEAVSTAEASDPAAQNLSHFSAPGQAPVVDPTARQALEKRLYEPAPTPVAAESQSLNADGSASAPVSQRRARTDAMPLDVGYKRAYFSSQPLIPVEADRTYPYSTVGMLFFNVPGEGDFACTASVIAPRLVLTAGHCVHTGSGNDQGWHSDFEFIPAYRDGVAPFGTWKGTRAFVSNPWYHGRGSVPNLADYGLIEIEDHLIDGVSRRIGEVVGYLGFQTNRLFPNHVHLLGYPAAFDSGERMHQVTAQSFLRGEQNTVLYGSDMNDGSSGGPWVMNFGDPAVGQSGFLQPERNQAIGVTSYGYPAGVKPVQGSSTLDDNFMQMRNAACANRAGNCP